MHFSLAISEKASQLWPSHICDVNAKQHIEHTKYARASENWQSNRRSNGAAHNLWDIVKVIAIYLSRLKTYTVRTKLPCLMLRRRRARSNSFPYTYFSFLIIPRSISNITYCNERALHPWIRRLDERMSGLIHSATDVCVCVLVRSHGSCLCVCCRRLHTKRFGTFTPIVCKLHNCSHCTSWGCVCMCVCAVYMSETQNFQSNTAVMALCFLWLAWQIYKNIYYIRLAPL